MCDTTFKHIIQSFYFCNQDKWYLNFTTKLSRSWPSAKISNFCHVHKSLDQHYMSFFCATQNWLFAHHPYDILLGWLGLEPLNRMDLCVWLITSLLNLLLLHELNTYGRVLVVKQPDLFKISQIILSYPLADCFWI